MAIKIGDAASLSDPENEQITTDDRQQIIEVIGGNVVQDYGHIESGDKRSWSLTFSRANWEIVKGYWNKRTLVTVTDQNKESFTARIVIKSYQRVKRFPGYITANIELWLI